MDREEIRHLIERLFVSINRHDLDGCVAHYSHTAELQDPTFPEPVIGAEHVREGFRSFFKAFPDVKAAVVDLIIDGEKCAVEWAFEGTHSGEYIGVPPSGFHFRTLTTSHFHFRDGKITRDFSMFDATALRNLESLASRQDA